MTRSGASRWWAAWLTLQSAVLAVPGYPSQAVKPAARRPPGGIIEGIVFLDRNGNGRRDAGEVGFAGARVELYNTGTGFGPGLAAQLPFNLARTPREGTFRFTVAAISGPRPDLGGYRVKVVPVEGHHFTTPSSRWFSRIESGKHYRLDVGVRRGKGPRRTPAKPRRIILPGGNG